MQSGAPNHSAPPRGKDIAIFFNLRIATLGMHKEVHTSYSVRNLPCQPLTRCPLVKLSYFGRLLSAVTGHGDKLGMSTISNQQLDYHNNELT